MKTNKLTPHRFLMLRRPLLPVTVIHRINNRVSKDPASLARELLVAYQAPLLREALFLASSDLYNQLEQLEQKAQPEEQKVLLSLYKYLVRACSRCTPFGLYAGYAIVELADKTELRFSGKIVRQTTLSAQVLQEMASRHIGISESEFLSVNTSLYQVGDSYRYTRRESCGNGQSHFVRKQVTTDPYLEAALQAAGAGRPRVWIAYALTQAGMHRKYANDYLSSLLDEQILLGPMQPTTSMQDFQSVIDARLQTGSVQAHLMSALKALAPPGSPWPDRYRRLQRALSQAGLPQDSPVQVDMAFCTVLATFSQKAVWQIISDLSQLLACSKKRQSHSLTRFARRFSERYGERQIPLLEALDTDYGIGYSHIQPLDNGHFLFQSPFLENKPAAVVGNERTQLINRAFHAAQSSSRTYYLLTKEDLHLIEAHSEADLTGGVSALGSIACESQADLDRGKFLFELKAVSGPGSTRLLSRFADADKKVAKVVKQINDADAAEFGETIFAEVLYVPCGRQANVCRRPASEGYQITLLSGPASSGINIPARELMVCVRDGEIILTHKGSGQRIIPRITTAHNPRLGPPAYQMLAELGGNETTLEPLWDWGHLTGYPFLPRIQFGKIVLSKAQWNIHSSGLPAKTADEAEIKKWWQSLRRRLKMPRCVELGSGDNQLMIDCNSWPAVLIALDALRKDGHLSVREVLQSSTRGWLRSANAVFCNELVIPIKTPYARRDYARPPKQLGSLVKRRPTESDGWLYVKIYASESSCERLLSKKISAFCAQLVRAAQIDEFFFLRYSDPEPHIRIRFYTGHTKRLSNRIYPRLLKCLEADLESGLVWRMQTQVYERELERYDVLPYPAIETIFYHDSRAAMQFLACPDMGGDQKDRRLWAMLACDGLLQAFGIETSGKLKMLQTFGSPLKKEELILLDSQFRAEKATIISWMNGDKLAEDGCLGLRNTFEERNQMIGAILGREPISDQAKRVRLAFDLMHLTCNRLFISDFRRQEHSVYHYLKKYYNFRLNVVKTSDKNLISNRQ